HLQSAIQILQHQTDGPTIDKINITLMIGNVYYELKDNVSAIAYYNQIVKWDSLVQKGSGVGRVDIQLSSTAYYRLAMHHLDESNNNPSSSNKSLYQAISYLESHLQLQKKLLNNGKKIISTLLTLSNLYYKINDFDNSKIKYRELLDLLDSFHESNWVLERKIEGYLGLVDVIFGSNDEVEVGNPGYWCKRKVLKLLGHLNTVYEKRVELLNGDITNGKNDIDNLHSQLFQIYLDYENCLYRIIDIYNVGCQSSLRIILYPKKYQSISASLFDIQNFLRGGLNVPFLSEFGDVVVDQGGGGRGGGNSSRLPPPRGISRMVR
ncbi:hypothetical protein HDU76_012563, partial [Blyttiomyces sp. JEL0837]